MKAKTAVQELERLRKANLARVHKYRAKKLKAKKLSEASTGGK
jgi:hypothetical protein